MTTELIAHRKLLIDASGGEPLISISPSDLIVGRGADGETKYMLRAEVVIVMANMLLAMKPLEFPDDDD